MENITLEAADIFENIPEEGITLKVQGVSMQPFLVNERDFVTLKKPEVKLKKGDIIVFKYGEMYLIHRIISIDCSGYVTAMGDYTFSPETGIPPENVKAVVVSAVRDGKLITPKSPEWLFFSKIFINTKFRKFLKKGRK